MRTATRIDPLARLTPSGSNLAAVLHRLRETLPDSWQELIAVTKIVFPALRDIRLPPLGAGQVLIVWDDGTPGGVDATELSDGTLQFLCVLAALYQPGDSLVAIDEPERGLHPDALYRIIGVAQKLSERRPVLFATQSDTLIDLLDDAPESLVIAERSGGASRFVRPDAETLRKWARDYGLASMRRELESWEPGE